MSSLSKNPIRQVLKNGELQEAPDSEVDYEFTSPSQLFTHDLNLIPFENAVQAQRTFYTTKFWNQALPIEHGEVPYIQTLRDPKTNESFHNYVGRKMGVVSANDEDDGATVSKITPDEMTLTLPNGKKVIKPLYNNYSFNRKSYLSNTPVVKVGDKIKKNQVLAKSNYTDDNGNLAMGTNARVAIVPYKGWTYEDSIVVSEDFAKRMASQHMYGYYQDKDDDKLKTGKTHYHTLFPDKFDKDQLEKIDDNGVIKVGQTVNYGDPLILSSKARMISSHDAELGRLSKYLKNTRNDAAIKWEHHSPGEVTDVVKTKNGWRVNVKTTMPLKEGDKITQLSGSKCYHPDTEIFTENGWKKVSEITVEDRVAALFSSADSSSQLNTYDSLHYAFVNPIATTSYNYDGLLYGLETDDIAYLVTPNHRVLSEDAVNGISTWSCKDASYIHSKRKQTFLSFKSISEYLIQIRVDNDKAYYTEQYNGPVYCCQVPGMGVILTKLHGKIMWNGNSTISKIIPMNEMPRTLDGKPLDILINPLTIPCFSSDTEILTKDHGWISVEDITTNEEYATLNPKTFELEYQKPTHVHHYAYKGPMYHLECKNLSILTTPNHRQFVKLPDTNEHQLIKSTDIFGIENVAYLIYDQSNNININASENRYIEEWSNYDGFVHCVTVPNSIVLVRRNNKANFSGNSRVNSSMIMSVLLGKVAEKTGKRYVLPSFNHKDESWYDFVEKELRDNNIPEVEDIYDPSLDSVLDQPVTVGNEYFLKLHHVGESKLSARDQGIYTMDRQPAKGGESGQKAKRQSGLENTAMLSAGAYNVIKDSLHLRGEKNDDYWRQVRMGQTPSLAKKSPFVWDKYIALMQGSGINPIDRGNSTLQASPFTDSQFERMQPIELKNAHIIDLKNFKPVEGGLFDPGMNLRDKWGKITLSEPYPNPGFEDAIASLLGIRKSDMYDIMQGNKNLGKYGSGNIAIYNALKNIDMDAMYKDARDQFKNGPKSSKQKYLNRIKYLKGLKANDLTPNELMITRVPVIPAKFRPYAVMGDTFLPGDVNELYKDVFQLNQVQKELNSSLGYKHAQENALNMYNSIKALYGFAPSKNRKLIQRGVSGFMNKLVGDTSKFSYLNRVVNSKPVDQSARGVIEMSPELNMDEIDIPNEMAYTIFAPYIQRELVKGGMRPRDAIKAIKNRDEATAGKALDVVMKERPLLFSRAPAWHSLNTLSAYGRRHEGNNILISPVVSTGAGADNDGDSQIGIVYVAIKK